MSRTINLYGHLKQETGYKSIEANVFSIREAVDFLVCNWPSLQAQILNNKYHVLVDDIDVEDMDDEELKINENVEGDDTDLSLIHI